MRHGEDELCAFAVLEVEQVLAITASRPDSCPKLNRIQRWEKEFLADLVHLVANDGNDLVERPLAERQIAVDASAELADISSTQKEFVACDLRVCGGFAEGGNEELRPTLHIRTIVSSELSEFAKDLNYRKLRT